MFRFKPLQRNSFLTKGEFYHERLYAKTITNLSAIGAWQNVESRTTFRDSNVVDFHYFLVPAEKENVTMSLEASRNYGRRLSLALATCLDWHLMPRISTAMYGIAQCRRPLLLVNGVELSLNQNYPFLQTFQSSFLMLILFPTFLFRL